jgi:hypothetical protein
MIVFRLVVIILEMLVCILYKLNYVMLYYILIFDREDYLLCMLLLSYEIIT